MIINYKYIKFFYQYVKLFSCNNFFPKTTVKYFVSVGVPLRIVDDKSYTGQR